MVGLVVELKFTLVKNKAADFDIRVSAKAFLLKFVHFLIEVINRNITFLIGPDEN
jgi:hypothetical protein